jgi:hypothetical protein
MLQVSIIAYLSGGAFLSLSYFDLPWHIIAISLLLGGLVAKKTADKPFLRQHAFQNGLENTPLQKSPLQNTRIANPRLGNPRSGNRGVHHGNT